jgi:Alcohol dehydrogenase transcription factor Myb/SANT-like
MSAPEKTLVIESFISFIKDHPPLWSLQHPQHKDLVIIRHSWEAILKDLLTSFSEELLISCKLSNLQELKQKFHNLRSTLCRERQKMKGKSGAGLSEVSGKTWTWMRQLQFLDQGSEVEDFSSSNLLESASNSDSIFPEDVSPSGPMQSEICLASITEESTSGLGEEVLREYIITNSGHLVLESSSMGCQGDTAAGSTKPPEKGASSKKWTPATKKQKSGSEGTQTSFKEACEAFKLRCQELNVKDDTTTFLDFLGVKLRSLDEKRRFDLQIQLLQLIQSFE